MFVLTCVTKWKAFRDARIARLQTQQLNSTFATNRWSTMIIRIKTPRHVRFCRFDVYISANENGLKWIEIFFYPNAYFK